MALYVFAYRYLYLFYICIPICTHSAFLPLCYCRVDVPRIHIHIYLRHDQRCVIECFIHKRWTKTACYPEDISRLDARSFYTHMYMYIQRNSETSSFSLLYYVHTYIAKSTEKKKKKKEFIINNLWKFSKTLKINIHE